jgi:hypothetical protein
MSYNFRWQLVGLATFYSLSKFEVVTLLDTVHLQRDSSQPILRSTGEICLNRFRSLSIQFVRCQPSVSILEDLLLC